VAQAHPLSLAKMALNDSSRANSTLVGHVVVDSCVSPQWYYAIPHLLLKKPLCLPSVDPAEALAQLGPLLAASPAWL